MESFLGMRVRLELLDGAEMEGLIRSLDDAGQLITLADVACLQADGRLTRFPGLLEVFGADIRNLELLGGSTGSNVLPSAAIKNSDSRHLQSNPNPAQSSRRSKGHAPALQPWAQDDARSIRSQDDFDFSASLSLFDKSRVFADLRAQDRTGAGERLVEHNLSGRGQVKEDGVGGREEKMRHTEPVLQQYGEDQDAEERFIKNPVSASLHTKKANKSQQQQLVSPVYQATIRRASSVKTPVATTLTLLRGPNGEIIDPRHFSSQSTSYVAPHIRVECAARSLTQLLMAQREEQAFCEVEFIVSTGCSQDDAFVAAVCYCTARHLVFAGLQVSVFPDDNAAAGEGNMHEVMAGHREFYDRVLMPARLPCLPAFPHETACVNGSQRDLPVPRPAALTLHLEHLPSTTANSTVVLLFNLARLAQQPAAQALAAMHPRSTNLFLGNDGASLSNGITSSSSSSLWSLFYQAPDGQLADYVRLQPFVQ